MDIKYLNDIPEYFKFYSIYNLPKYQITARDVRSGALFYFYTYVEKCNINNNLSKTII